MNRRCTYCGGTIEEGATPTRYAGPGTEFLHPACLKKVQKSTNVATRFLRLFLFAMLLVAVALIYYFVFP